MDAILNEPYLRTRLNVSEGRVIFSITPCATREEGSHFEDFSMYILFGLILRTVIWHYKKQKVLAA
jgi:hypothetical protein